MIRRRPLTSKERQQARRRARLRHQRAEAARHELGRRRLQRAFWTGLVGMYSEGRIPSSILAKFPGSEEALAAAATSTAGKPT